MCQNSEAGESLHLGNCKSFRSAAANGEGLRPEASPVFDECAVVTQLGAGHKHDFLT